MNAESELTIESRRTLADIFHNAGTAWIILLLSVSITIAAWYLSDRFVSQRINDRFAFQTEDIKIRIQQRLKDQYLILKAGVGLVDASEEVTRAEWHNFVDNLALDENFPGLLGYGFSLVVPPEQLSSHIAGIRAEGFPDYRLNPGGQRDFYTAIIFLEPFNWRNRRAFGYDMYSEVTRREAMARAMKTGEMAISGRVTLVQETAEDVQHGFLMYLPTYRLEEGYPLTEVDRVRQIFGFVYSPFRMGDLMTGILGTQDREIEYAIYDSSADGGKALMYSSSGARSHEGVLQAMGDAEIKRELAIPFGGREWSLQLFSKPDFVQNFERNQPTMIAITGGIIDILLFVVLLSLAQQKKRVTRQANKISREAVKNAHRLQTIFNSVEQGLVTVDEKGVVLSANPAVLTLFGQRPVEIVGSHISAYIAWPPPDQLEIHYREKRKAAREKSGQIGEKGDTSGRFPPGKSGPPSETRDESLEGDIPQEMTGLRRDGTEFPIEITVKPIELAATPGTPELSRFLWVIRDLTEQQKVQKLQNDFIATVSHELRTPLTAIQGSLKLILGNAVPPPVEGKARQMLEIASDNCQRLGLLINDILDIEKLASGDVQVDMQKYPVSDLLHHAVVANQYYAERYGARILVENDAEGAEIQVDKLRFQQVMSNLLSNAAKFSPQESEILIRASRRAESIRVEVQDQGGGVPSRFRPYLFKRFSQADTSSSRQAGGSGLGLYISRKLMELMGGHIGLESSIATGACFFVELPDYTPNSGARPHTAGE